MSIKVAIVGSGPAGYYTADALLKKFDDIEVDVIDRLPTPYGLIRFGVAPDHQNTKKIMNAFEKTAMKDNVAYYGNVELSKDVSLEELRALYDAVVLSTGAGNDRMAPIEGIEKKGVYGSATFVNWYNAHPDQRNLDPDLDTESAVVIGNGNVALDVARVLVRSDEEIAETDIPDHVAEKIRKSPLKNVYIVGRRGPLEAKFTNAEFRELGHLENCVTVAEADQIVGDPSDLEDEREARIKEKSFELLRQYAENKPGEKDKTIHLKFFSSPVEILGDDTVEGIKLEKTEVKDGKAVGTGEFFEIPCGLVVAAIGYRSLPIDGAPFEEKSHTIPNEDGRVEKGLYVAGWIKRGPSGVISTNRPDGVAVAEHVAKEISDGGKDGGKGLEALLKEKGVRFVSFEDWKKIEKAEFDAAADPAPRKKFVTVEDMLAVLEQ